MRPCFAFDGAPVVRYLTPPARPEERTVVLARVCGAKTP